MPKKNQKVMSDDELKILEESKQDRKTKQEERKAELAKVKKEIFEEEKKQLPEKLKEKTEGILTLLEEKKKISYSQMYSLISKSMSFANKNIYSNDELVIAFQEFQEMVNKINNTQQFVPTINVFCAYIGVSTSTYKSWLASNDELRREVVQMIDDYLADVALSLAQNKKLDALVTMYRTKSQHNMVEATSPIIIEHRKGADIDEISERVKMIKKGGIVIDADYKEKEK